MLIEAPFVERLLTHVKKYQALSDVVISEESLSVYFDLDGSYSPRENDIVIRQKSGKVIVTSNELESKVSEEEFTLFRLKHAIPVQGIDYDQEMLLNLGDETLVDYDKGCYLGQEIIARVHYRGKAPKKLVVLTEELCIPKEVYKITSKAVDPRTKKLSGFVFKESK